MIRKLLICTILVFFVLGIFCESQASIKDGTSPETARFSAYQILTDGYSVGDGFYWIDPDGQGGNSPFLIYADMTRDGGGWTLGLKTWYQAGHYHNPNDVGTVNDALTLKGLRINCLMRESAS